MVVHSQITSSLNPNVVDLQNFEIELHASFFTNLFTDISKGSLLVLLSQDLVIRQWVKILYMHWRKQLSKHRECACNNID